jgi:hypothetical protein
MEGKIRKKLIAVGGYPFASLHPLEGAAAQLSSHRRVGDFWRPAFGGRYRNGDALSGALAMARHFGVRSAHCRMQGEGWISSSNITDGFSTYLFIRSKISN